MPRRTHSLRPGQVAALRRSTVVRVADLVELGPHRATIAHRRRPGGPRPSLVPGIVLRHSGTWAPVGTTRPWSAGEHDGRGGAGSPGATRPAAEEAGGGP